MVNSWPATSNHLNANMAGGFGLVWQRVWFGLTGEKVYRDQNLSPCFQSSETWKFYKKARFRFGSERNSVLSKILRLGLLNLKKIVCKTSTSVSTPNLHIV